MATVLLNMGYSICNNNPKCNKSCTNCTNCNISVPVVPCIPDKYQTNRICKHAFDLNKPNKINMTQEGKVSRYLSFIVYRYETCTELYRDTLI